MKQVSKSSNIEQSLQSFLEKADILGSNCQVFENKLNYLEGELKNCFFKKGLVKYTAYTNTANDSCFALALLDRNNSGFVFNGIYSTEMTNITVKQVYKGVVKDKISDEESKAIQIAILRNE